MSFLEITVLNAANLPNVETYGKSDPYATISFMGVEKKTEVIKEELNPAWNETFTFNLHGKPLNEAEKINIQIKDWERIGKSRLLGQAIVSLSGILKDPANILQINSKLFDGDNRPTSAEVNISIHYKKKQEENTMQAAGPQESNINSDGAGDASLPTAHLPPPEPLSDKPQDFQIRVLVTEARQLLGNNLQAVCRVRISTDNGEQTKVKKNTNTPFWNETFYFNLNEAPATLMQKNMQFLVYDAKLFRSDAIIGQFTLPLLQVYSNRNHAILQRWLLLTESPNKGTECCGYLKVSIAIVGPGDTPPVFSTNVQSSDEADISSNLMRAAGVQLRPAMLLLRVYRGEDLPVMDSESLVGGLLDFLGGDGEKKQLVDPYVLFSFAGKTAKTSIKYNQFDPEWNEEIQMLFEYPSMCDNLKITLMDWDRVGSDEAIATANIKLSQISCTSSPGYPPTFGPCFINFYGGPREHSSGLDSEHQKMNEGKYPGVAYRGRLMLELGMKVLGEAKNITECQSIPYTILTKTAHYMKRTKYNLHGVFYEANMFPDIDGPVEFEVTIGSNGYCQPSFQGPSSSMTPPTNTAFDGNMYHFLPWECSKPCVHIECMWEHVNHRLESVNMISRIAEKLHHGITELKKKIKQNVDMNDLRQLAVQILNRLIIGCKLPLPDTPKGVAQTKLEVHIKKRRADGLLNISQNAERQNIRLQAISIDDDLKTNDTIIDEKTVNELNWYLQSLKTLMIEPENSIPDVFIWMTSGTEKHAYARIPAHTILYSINESRKGKNCGQIQNIVLKYPGEKGINNLQLPGILRVKLWLGVQENEEDWENCHTEGKLAVFAETYENQVSLLGTWTNKGPTMSRPKWSDVSGRTELNKSDFHPPDGWRWDGDWFISSDPSVSYERDDAVTEYIEDVFENEARTPGKQWAASDKCWTNVHGDSTRPRDEIKCPLGWEWKKDWKVDLKRVVDDQGWQYCAESTIGGWTSQPKLFHQCRRRRWTRKRLKQPSEIKSTHKIKCDKTEEGWEYSTLFTTRYHAKGCATDFVRRRRWHRKMIPEGGFSDAPIPIFDMQSSKHSDVSDVSDSDNGNRLTSPRLLLTFDTIRTYQLRGYIYQARNVLSEDDDIADPFCSVSCFNQSLLTNTIINPLCPTWDETLVFHKLTICGDPEMIAKYPPTIVIEIMNGNEGSVFSTASFLGRVITKPVVRITPNDTQNPMLAWLSVAHNTADAELLCAFELYLVDGNELPTLPTKHNLGYQVPDTIRPHLQRTGIEILCWGARNLGKFDLQAITSPQMEFECGDNKCISSVIKNVKKNPNFPDPTIFMDIMIPKEAVFLPQLIIRMRENRQFGGKPVVGSNIIKKINNFKCDPYKSHDPKFAITWLELPTHVHDTNDSTILAIPDIDVKPKKSKIKVHKHKKSKQNKRHKQSSQSLAVQARKDIDWWSKYYASKGEYERAGSYMESHYINGELMNIYETELERAEEHFHEFEDFCNTFELKRNVHSINSNSDSESDDEDDEVTGEFKGMLFVYPLPSDRKAKLPPKMISSLPSSTPIEYIVRVYIIQAIGLQPKDSGGLADPYVEIQLGDEKMDNRDEYKPNTLNPIYGQVFEIPAMIPLNKNLVIRIKDYDLIGSDELIGETRLDLEDRYLSKCRATCGIPRIYCESGINAWRDAELPIDILNEFCNHKKIPVPIWETVAIEDEEGDEITTEKAVVGTKTFFLNKFEKNSVLGTEIGPPRQRLALHILNHLPLVKEHVESRRLYSPLQPAIEQGRLQMWVDMFPKSLRSMPTTVDITARTPQRYILRCIVWKTSDVIADEVSITGDAMSDIYIRGWISGIEEKQETDVHYRCLSGEGIFNWRLVFPFDYLPAEQCVVIRQKEHFWSLDETEQRLPPKLVIQVWDNDIISSDDFLGEVILDLNDMPAPAKSASKCNLKQLPSDVTGIPPSKKQSSGKSKKTPTVNLLKGSHRMQGWWPCTSFVEEEGSENAGKRVLTGKVELELEILTEEEAEAKPAGCGRDDPNAHPTLPEPNRPDSDLLWFFNPWKVFKLVIWRRFKWYIIIFLLLAILAGVLVIVYINLPKAMINSWFGPAIASKLP